MIVLSDDKVVVEVDLEESDTGTFSVKVTKPGMMGSIELHIGAIGEPGFVSIIGLCHPNNTHFDEYGEEPPGVPYEAMLRMYHFWEDDESPSAGS